MSGRYKHIDNPLKQAHGNALFARAFCVSPGGLRQAAYDRGEDL